MRGYGADRDGGAEDGSGASPVGWLMAAGQITVRGKVWRWIQAQQRGGEQQSVDCGGLDDSGGIERVGGAECSGVHERCAGMLQRAGY